MLTSRRSLGELSEKYRSFLGPPGTIEPTVYPDIGHPLVTEQAVFDAHGAPRPPPLLCDLTNPNHSKEDRQVMHAWYHTNRTGSQHHVRQEWFKDAVTQELALEWDTQVIFGGPWDR